MDFNTAKLKAKELVSKMTVEEKASQLLYNSPAIERLGIHEYNWWNESSHGVARAGTATVFPHSIGLAATFDPERIFEVADVISTEARVKFNQHDKRNDYDIYKGLTFWAPNINIFRDPRWGRGQETLGEDPFLTSVMATAYIHGIQGEGEFLKAAACSKHFAAHSGPEGQRHSFDAEVSMHDLWETYLPAFEKTVKEGVVGVMGAYNRINGEPCCASRSLLSDILREQWGFEGYITSDCGALKDIVNGHKLASSTEEAAAMALKSGCDLNCGDVYSKLIDAYEEDLITEEDITNAAEHLYAIRFLLGEFEHIKPYHDLPYDLLDCKNHRELNLKTAEESIVLLKNENNFLPIKRAVKRIAVVGPNAISVAALEGNYYGYASEYVTLADGIRREFSESDIKVECGCRLVKEKLCDWNGFSNMYSDGIAAAESADVTVLCLGLDCTVEGEEIQGAENEYLDHGDRKSLFLPKPQQKLAEMICDACENVIVFLMCGGSIDIGEKVRNHAKAILYGWYPGALGGLAVARVISGKANPCGRLPITVYRGDDVIPDFSDYSMRGRTYRYMTGKPLYPFGYGLSYTDFSYDGAFISYVDDEKAVINVDITNEGKIEGTEKVQVYAEFSDSRTPTPNFQLCAVRAIRLGAGERKTVSLEIDRYWLKAVLEDGTRTAPDGEIAFYVGSSQPDGVSSKLTGKQCIKLKLS